MNLDGYLRMENATVTIDLNGHKLNRGLSESTKLYNGGVINVKGGTLTGSGGGGLGSPNRFINISNFRSMYEATGTTLQSAYYWSSTDGDGNNAWDVYPGTSTATFYANPNGHNHLVLACLAF